MNNKGFIALISIILISAGLLIVVLEISTAAHFAQHYLQENIYKQQSLYAAKSCMNIALLQYEENNEYDGDEIKKSGAHSCTIFPFEHEGGFITITTQAKVSFSQTTLVQEIHN